MKIWSPKIKKILEKRLQEMARWRVMRAAHWIIIMILQSNPIQSPKEKSADPSACERGFIDIDSDSDAGGVTLTVTLTVIDSDSDVGGLHWQ